MWDLRKLGGQNAMCYKNLDAYSSIMYLHLDYDLNVAFVSNKGSHFLSMFYLNESSKNGKPELVEISKY